MLQKKVQNYFGTTGSELVDSLQLFSVLLIFLHVYKTPNFLLLFLNKNVNLRYLVTSNNCIKCFCLKQSDAWQCPS